MQTINQIFVGLNIVYLGDVEAMNLNTKEYQDFLLFAESVEGKEYQSDEQLWMKIADYFSVLLPVLNGERAIEMAWLHNLNMDEWRHTLRFIYWMCPENFIELNTLLDAHQETLNKFAERLTTYNSNVPRIRMNGGENEFN
jgi:hypothetical protein